MYLEHRECVRRLQMLSYYVKQNLKLEANEVVSERTDYATY